MQTNFCATAAVIFSRVSAPPPPLIMCRCSVISSAPSMYTGSSFTLFRSNTRMPCFFRRSALASEAATAPSMRPLMVASASMNLNTVEPEPTPTIASSTTCFSASRATSSFSASWVMSSFLLLLLRRQVGAHTLEQLRGHADRFAGGGMRVDGLADVGGVGAHLDRERELADQVARAGADDRAAHQAVRLRVEQQLGETLVAAIGDGTPRSGPGKLRHADRGALLPRLVLGQADPGDLRIRVRHRRNHARIEVRFHPGGRLRGDMTFVHRLVREHRITRDVADGEDVRHAGAHLTVDRDESLGIDRHTGIVCVYPLAVRHTSVRDHDHVVGPCFIPL